MKKFGLVITTLSLFAFSVYLAFVQGSTPLVEQRNSLGALWMSGAGNNAFGGGLKGFVANAFSTLMNGLLNVTGHNVLLALVLLALVVELVLLYPSISLQLKQKKIHLFHKKVVDRFNRGEFAVSAARHELQKVYDVNEKMHTRGAVLVAIQAVVFFFTFWGLGLMVQMPNVLAGSWSALSLNLLKSPEAVWVPLLASLVYFFHAAVKMYYKEREDYLSPMQGALGFLFAILGSAVVYYFSGFFATALTVYFVTLVTLSTVRTIVVEQHAQRWGKLAHLQMLQMLRDSKPEKDRFQYFSRKWNHLPMVRHLNFALLEEGLSMTIGLLIALSFFGGFQKTDRFYASMLQPEPIVTVDLQPMP